MECAVRCRDARTITVRAILVIAVGLFAAALGLMWSMDLTGPLAAIWLAVGALVAAGLTAIPLRIVRIPVASGLAVLCVLFGWEGGLFVLPALLVAMIAMALAGDRGD